MAIPTVLHGKPQAGTEAQKPASPDVPGTFFATDTGRLWMFDGTYWWYLQFTKES